MSGEMKLKDFCRTKELKYNSMISAIKRAEAKGVDSVKFNDETISFRFDDGLGRGGKVCLVWIADDADTTNVTNVTNDDDPMTHRVRKNKDRQTNEAMLKAKACLLAFKRKRGVSLEKFVSTLGPEFADIKVNSINMKRWMREYKKAVVDGKDGMEALMDNRGRPKGGAALTEEHQKSVLSYLLRRDIRPNIALIHRQCSLIYPDMPSLRTMERWVENWKRENRLLWAQCDNPDKAKSHFLPAFGNASEAYRYKNAAWELDATKADVMTDDGIRWTIYGLMDVYSRRVCVTLERNTSSYAVSRNLREGMLKLGVPELLITDNGRDYTSNHIDDMCIRMGIGKREVEPYSGQKKPHIERFFGTMTRGLFEKIQGFIGHNTKERAEITSRQSLAKRHEAIRKWREAAYNAENFSKALTKRENAEIFVEVPVSSEKLRELIDEWVLAYENINVHRGIKMTPMAKWNSDDFETRNIGDERMLDMLMGESMVRTVSKNGIRIKKDSLELEYKHSDLVAYIGEKVNVILDDNLAFVHVYDTEGSYICTAVEWAVNPDIQRSTVKDAHKEYRRSQSKANKLIKEAETRAKELDAISEAAFSQSVKEFKNSEDTRVKREYDEVGKSDDDDKAKGAPSGVKKYDGLVDRFVQRMMDGSWNEKDDALARANKDLYEIAVSKVNESRRVG